MPAWYLTLFKPVHAAGRFFRNSLVEILKNDFGFEKTYSTSIGEGVYVRYLSFAAVNRLDRLTSGLMILPLNAKLANTVTQEFMNGQVRKEYVARCNGKFPEYADRLDRLISQSHAYITSGKRLYAKNHS